MRKVDVMMIPIDARLNLDFADIVRVIEQVNPPVVIPMHYDDVVQAEIFTEFIGTRYPVSTDERFSAAVKSRHSSDVD